MDLLQLSPFPSVAANARASLATRELEGRSVHGLLFQMTGTFDRSHVDDVRIRAGGKDLLEGITGAQLQDINDYLGLNADASFFAHWFGDPLARTIRGQHLGDLDLSVYGDSPLELEVDVGGATGPGLNVFAVVGAPKVSMGIGLGEGDAQLVRAMTRTVITESAAVSRKAYPISLGSEAGARVRAMHLFHSNLTSAELRKAGDIKHDDIAVAVNTYFNEAFADRVAQSGLYTLDRIPDGNQGEAEPTIQSNGKQWPIQVRLTTSGADTITAFSDLITAVPLL